MNQAEQILEFWFAPEDTPEALKERTKLWFQKSPVTDHYIKDRFGALLEAAAAGGLKDWETGPQTRLALIVLLDQFSRNRYRDTPGMFAQDERARGLTRLTISKGEDKDFRYQHRYFSYMPLMHSELLADQEESLRVFGTLVEDVPQLLKQNARNAEKYARQHHGIVARFGRFPHRNRILGRESTPEEEAFLKEPGSSF